MATVQRIVILGRGGAGKTTLGRRLGWLLDLPVVALDDHFWSEDLAAMAPDEWARLQEKLADPDRWVLDGDLGPHDVLAPRLRRADTVIVLDPGLARCAWRALRRSRERLDFWWWLLTWRRTARPRLAAAIRAHAPGADLHVLLSPRDQAAFLRRRL